MKTNARRDGRVTVDGSNLTADFSKMDGAQLAEWCRQSEEQQYAPARGGMLVLSKDGSIDGNGETDDALDHAGESLTDTYASPEAAEIEGTRDLLEAVKAAVPASVFELVCAMNRAPLSDTGNPDWAEVGRQLGITRQTAYFRFKTSYAKYLPAMRAAVLASGFKPRKVTTEEQYVARQCRSIGRQVRRQVRLEARAGLI